MGRQRPASLSVSLKHDRTDGGTVGFVLLGFVLMGFRSSGTTPYLFVFIFV